MAKSSPAIAGRRREQRLLQRILESPDPELAVVYGRRRVGKTHLIREFFRPNADTYFEVTGQHAAPMEVQLSHFQTELERVFFDRSRLPRLTTWEEGFDLLAGQLEARAAAAPRKPMVVFLDELPWLATQRSRLLPAIDHCWNSRLSRLRNLRLVLCGSAASFMLERLIRAKGGLHDRVTHRLRLEPFTLGETREFLSERGVRLGNIQLLELYLAIGGIPHYQLGARRGQSAAQLVGELCFSQSGLLRDEFSRLFASLFRDSEGHEAVVRALAGKRSGLSRSEIASHIGTTSGGGLARRLMGLEEAGFITGTPAYGKQTKDTLYRLTDEYSLFYLDWIEPASKRARQEGGAKYWTAKASTPRWTAWAGYAFENVCFSHAGCIERALGIDHLAPEFATWRFIPSRGSNQQGAQIDLLFDRQDGVITLCEVKHTREPFTITKAYARELKRKISVFTEQTRTHKDVQLALVTSHEFVPNIWSKDLVDSVVTLDALFEPAN